MATSTSDLNPTAQASASRGLAVKSTNPKDLLAVNRTPLWLIPGPAKIHQALAHLDGARKYGPYNWRDEAVDNMQYVSAVQRHLDDYVDGEDMASDSLVHHLAHAIAGLNIMLDSLALGNLIDSRPTPAATGAMHGLVQPFIAGEDDYYLHRGDEFARLVELDEDEDGYSGNGSNAAVEGSEVNVLDNFSDAELLAEVDRRGISF